MEEMRETQLNISQAKCQSRADPSSSTKWYELKVGPFKITKVVLESLRHKKLGIIPVLRIPSNGPYVNIYHRLCWNIITIYLGVFHGLSGFRNENRGDLAKVELNEWVIFLGEEVQRHVGYVSDAEEVFDDGERWRARGRFRIDIKGGRDWNFNRDWFEVEHLFLESKEEGKVKWPGTTNYNPDSTPKTQVTLRFEILLVLHFFIFLELLGSSGLDIQMKRNFPRIGAPDQTAALTDTRHSGIRPRGWRRSGRPHHLSIAAWNRAVGSNKALIQRLRSNSWMISI
ncbi:hypothetical protein IEQ34_010728 [Dendrobium chrysotoxum]|uniref:Uncharacterized protein n=1 Tax=Dendrobium chrysotoxum TaxID=161865 RepID=A0AAV7GE77_DENCH|nr:hypothetical protein IEQ34_010728 [Dendrobium chrysotoxum]